MNICTFRGTENEVDIYHIMGYLNALLSLELNRNLKIT